MLTVSVSNPIGGRDYDCFEDLDIATELAKGLCGFKPGRPEHLPPEDDEVQCEVCKTNGLYDWDHNQGGIRVRYEWRYGLFRGCQGRIMDDTIGAFCMTCEECAGRLLPFLVRLRDLYELNSFINLLGRAISERRAKDNGTTKNASCKRNKGTAERGSRHRASSCAA